MNDFSLLPVVFQQFPYFGFGESDHVVEYRVGALIAGDIEATCEIVHRYRADTGDETALDAGIGSCFHLVEEGAQIAFAMCLVGVTMQTLRIGEDGIGKVVVLIDEEINFTVRLLPKRRGRMKKKNLSASSIMGIKRVLST